MAGVAQAYQHLLTIDCPFFPVFRCERIWNSLDLESPVQIRYVLIQIMRIADAYELAAGNDPLDVSFDQGKIYKHLVQCSEKGRFWTFSAIVEHR